MCFIFYFLGFSGFVEKKVEWGIANTDDATTPITQISGERGAQNKQIRRDVLMCGASTGSALGLYLFTPPSSPLIVTSQCSQLAFLLL